jgi:hypothetical protein
MEFGDRARAKAGGLWRDQELPQERQSCRAAGSATVAIGKQRAEFLEADAIGVADSIYGGNEPQPKRIP